MILKKGLNGKAVYRYSTESQRATLLRHGEELVEGVVLEVCIRACWVKQILQCSTGGHISCDIMIYHSPVEQWRSECVSANGLLMEFVGSGVHAAQRTRLKRTERGFRIL